MWELLSTYQTYKKHGEFLRGFLEIELDAKRGFQNVRVSALFLFCSLSEGTLERGTGCILRSKWWRLRSKADSNSRLSRMLVASLPW